MDTPPITPDIPSADDLPKKYIRTLAGDIETLHQGGTPDLVPLAKSTPLETYAGDFSDRMKEEKASFATVLAAEQDSSSPQLEVAEQKISRNGLLYFIAGGVLLIAGITGATIAYMRYMAAIAPVEPATSASAPIFVDEREQISGTGAALFQAIERSVAHSLPFGTVRLLSLASTTVDENVLSALRTSAPDVLLRNITANDSMAGVVNVGGTQSPFFILSVASYSDTFAGMLSFERSMPRDLAALFPPYPANVSNTTATSTAATSTPPVSAAVLTFRDEIVRNHDVRVYRDGAGKSVLLYGYWNQTTLVIARDPAAFTEIVERLATSRTQP